MLYLKHWLKNEKIISKVGIEMYDKKIERYDVIIYEKTICNQWHYLMTKEFLDIESAIDYGRKEKEKGNRVKIKEVLKILNWE